MTERADIVVVGAGHAGVEAAVAAARLGVRVVLLNTDLEDVAGMPCNPSVGGVGKGHLVREIDALGGVMGRLADAASIGTRTLNTSKGAAVQAPRAQCDRRSYRTAARELLFSTDNLRLLQGHAAQLLVEDDHVVGLRTDMGVELSCRAVVLATGTFLGGEIFVGLNSFAGGRDNARAATALRRSLLECGVELVRLKTGTSPRLDAATVDTGALVRQDPEEPPPRFSFSGPPPPGPFLPCYLTATTPVVHEAIRRGLEQSPLYTGLIEGVGPRYCPSIEDKVVRFPEREVHQLFLEPTGLDGDEYYVSGLATSLAYPTQLAMLAAIPGLERAVVTRPGYAVVYDCLAPHQLSATLAVEGIAGLFACGQLCGSSGYEEAAAQGLLVGINAALYVEGRGREFTLRRDQAYIGVLIDDLIQRWGAEPYRVFTARAEHRLALRADNADGRLTALGAELGLIGEDRARRSERKYRWRDLLVAWADGRRLDAADCRRLGRPELAGLRAAQLVPRRDVDALELLTVLAASDDGLPAELRSSLTPSGPARESLRVAVNDLRYAGYLRRHAEAARREERLAATRLPADIDYDEVLGLRTEAAQKLSRQRPRTLGQARRVPGVNPADITPLLSYLRRRRRLQPAEED